MRSDQEASYGPAMRGLWERGVVQTKVLFAARMLKSSWPRPRCVSDKRGCGDLRTKLGARNKFQDLAVNLHVTIAGGLVWMAATAACTPSCSTF